MKKIKIGILGGAGYTAGELLRILVQHPDAEIVFVHSNSSAGKYISDVHTDLIGDTDSMFTNNIVNDIDVLFLCVGHGEAKNSLKQFHFDEAVKIIDLSQDHRLNDPEFVYGLPELNKSAVAGAVKIANPGCFATCIQLALLPLASGNMLKDDIHISAITGSTGVGQSLSATSHFSWRSNNISIYKAFGHQHIHEIVQSLKQLQPDFKSDLNFIPFRGCFSRGIFASVYTRSDLRIDEAYKLYENFYKAHPFVHISLNPIDLKQTVNTNKCLLHLEKYSDKLLITSCIDNLLKGASGQAVQNMNLLFGLDETTGLRLKASCF